MYNETQLQAIRLFGDKTLSFGCWIQYGDAILQYSHEGASCHIFVNKKETGAVEKGKEEFIKILGHIPNLSPDLMSRFKEIENIEVKILKDEIEIFGWVRTDGIMSTLSNENTVFSKIKSIFYDHSKSLLDQPDLEEIVNLFQ